MTAGRRRVFVSYRREDCAAHARLLEMSLEADGRHDVFLDVQDIGLGEDFTETIEREIAGADVVLVLIGPRWSSGVADEPSRLDDEADWVRREIATALQCGRPTIPVLVAGARMPDPQQLPADIRPLARRQGTELRDASWPDDVARLVRQMPAPSERPGTGADSGPALLPEPDDLSPGLLAILQLDAHGTGAVTAEEAASLADYDVETVLRYLRECEQQDVEWHQSALEAAEQGDEEERLACEHERDSWTKTAEVLRAALRLAVQARAGEQGRRR